MKPVISRAIVVSTMCALLVAGCDELPQPDKERPKHSPSRTETVPRAKVPRETSFVPATLPVVHGHVTAVSKTEITIRASARTDIITYPLHDELAAGGVHEHATHSMGFRAQDVRVGDEVWLGICTEEGKKFCAEISIRKRPGGRVPEAFVDSLKPSYAVRKNAENDFNDFGIPVPQSAKPK